MLTSLADESESEEESSDESVDVPVAAPRRKFDDEEDSDDVRSPRNLYPRLFVDVHRSPITGKKRKPRM